MGKLTLTSMDSRGSGRTPSEDGSKPSLGSSQSLNPSSGPPTNNISGENIVANNESGPNVSPSYQENGTITNPSSARATQSSPQMDLSNRVEPNSVPTSSIRASGRSKPLCMQTARSSNKHLSQMHSLMVHLLARGGNEHVKEWDDDDDGGDDDDDESNNDNNDKEKDKNISN
ncbi:hypothetical protein RIF29_18337 [Crotalaria pallida]|uniref:Uncharacterized protein n=1 Tax=Crotalaria pallida TaxID=3830 RepID=A0AAN9FM07_CROPI